MTLDEANALPADAFVARFGGVFEHSPWVAERVAAQRPFADIASLHAAMCAQVEAAGEAAQLALLRAHPELGAARLETLTPASAAEQAAAGLSAPDPGLVASITANNVRYRERFGFPFIVAVRGLAPKQILLEQERRRGRSREEEFAEALRQVERIARLRLEAMIGPEAH